MNPRRSWDVNSTYFKTETNSFFSEHKVSINHKPNPVSEKLCSYFCLHSYVVLTNVIIAWIMFIDDFEWLNRIHVLNRTLGRWSAWMVAGLWLRRQEEKHSWTQNYSWKLNGILIRQMWRAKKKPSRQIWDRSCLGVDHPYTPDIQSLLMSVAELHRDT